MPSMETVQLQRITFDTTAARLAYVFGPNDIGRTIVQDNETGLFYLCVSSGAGALSTVRFGPRNTSRTETVPISLYDFREVSSGGDVSDIAGNGGILASDTTPIMRGDAAETAEIGWATTVVDPISTQISLPGDFDGTRDAYIDLQVYSGTTNAASFVVETGWDGGALVSDTADDAATLSATRHIITATIAAADIPNTARSLTLALTPPAHATNAIQLTAAFLRYFPA